MNIDKLFYKTLLINMFSDGFEIMFWDGSVENCGEGESKFKIILNEPIPKDNIINDPSIALGEAYMTKKLEIEGNIQSVIESLYCCTTIFINSSFYFSNLIIFK